MKVKKLGVYFLVALLLVSFYLVEVFAAEVGDKLEVAESGWKRYDDTNSNIEYIGEWETFQRSWFYDGIRHQAANTDDDSKIRFNFTGDKLLLLSTIYSGYSDKIQITIDNEIIDYFSEYNESLETQMVSYVITDLEDKEHYVEITKINTGSYGVDFCLDAIDIDENGELKPYSEIVVLDAPVNLVATGGNAEVTLAWEAVDDADSYNIYRSITSGESYTAVAEEVYLTSYTDTDVTNDTTYYYVITAVNTNGESDNSDEASVTPEATETLTLDIEASSYEITGGAEFETYVIVNNASDIYAEDINITYDTTLFELISAEVVDSNATQIYYEDAEISGQARYIVASMGLENALDGEVQILKLTFSANNVDGSGDIAVTSGLVADGDGNELVALTSGKTFTVTSAIYGDVNNDGSFTLGDLAIAGRLFSTTSESWDAYEPDIDLNGTVEDVDLTTIVQAILASE